MKFALRTITIPPPAESTVTLGNFSKTCRRRCDSPPTARALDYHANFFAISSKLLGQAFVVIVRGGCNVLIAVVASALILLASLLVTQSGTIRCSVCALQNNAGIRTDQNRRNPSFIFGNLLTERPDRPLHGDPEPLLRNSGLASQAQLTNIPRGFTLLSAPPAPELAVVSVGSFPAHSDYVKITLVTLSGESPPSDESVNSLGPNALTVVRSPTPFSAGVIGYNVYAVKNNGGSGLGETLQNRVPVPLGTDYVEPPTGWSSARATPPTAGSAFVPIPDTKFTVTPSGGYIDMVLFSASGIASAGAAILPLNNAPLGTTISITAFPGPNEAASVPGRVLETFRFVLNRDVTFVGVPSFKPKVPSRVKSGPPYVMELHDGETGALLAVLPSFPRSKLAFFSDYAGGFRAMPNRAYYFELITEAPFELAGEIPNVPSDIPLPVVKGIHAIVNVPAATIEKDARGSSFDAILSDTRPVGLPPLVAPSDGAPFYYASVSIYGTASYRGEATLSITLPQSDTNGKTVYALAAYDSGFESFGWFTGFHPTRVDGNVLMFKLPLPHFLGWRQYGLALYKETTAREPMPFRFAPVDVAVVGASLSKLTILPPSQIGCRPGYGPLPDCQYSLDPSSSWPGQLEKIIHSKVLNLSQLGARTTLDNLTGASMLSLQVPQIPPTTKIVICQWGGVDLGYGDQSPPTMSARATEMTKAIRARAPLARIIYIGTHCSPGCSKAGITAWEAADKRLASGGGGAYFDLQRVGPDGINAAFPDGGHLSLASAHKLAIGIAAVIRRLQRP